MENIRDLQIQVDLLYGALPVSRNLKQGDTTRLTLTVFRGGKSYPLESLTPILNAKRADKLIYIQTSDYDVNDNSITYNLAPQIVAEPGRLQLEIELDDADGNIISSFTIGITVEPRLFNGEEDVAPDDQNEIIDAAREAALSVAQARDAAQTAVDARDTAVQTINTSRDNAVADVNQAADKRVDEINAMGVNGTVRFDEAQELTDAQMTQARANVGAASAAEVDKLSDENANLKGDLADKLPKSPVNWEPWTAEEQAAARERIGASKKLGIWEDIATVNITEDADAITVNLDANGNTFSLSDIICEITIPAEKPVKQRHIYFGLNISTAFTFSKVALATNERYISGAITYARIVSGRVICDGAISGPSNTRYQPYYKYAIFNGHGEIEAESFDSVSVFTYSNAFPAGTTVILKGIRT